MLRARTSRRSPRTPARPDEQVDERPVQFSDAALALRFRARHADGVKHVAAWGKWLIWDGTAGPRTPPFARSTSPADLLAASAQALRTIDDARTATRTATKVASAQVIAAVLKIAQADRSIARRADIGTPIPGS